MSFRPARFTDIHRSGPPTTSDGMEWSIRVSAQPPLEWSGSSTRMPAMATGGGSEP